MHAPDSSSRFYGSTLLCVAVLLAGVLIAHPVLEIGMSDDFSYVWTAKRAAETGRMLYNGWACPMLGYMVYLAAIIIKLFGFSYTKARAAVVLISLANAAVLHRLLLRVTGNNYNAVVATCAFTLSFTAFMHSLIFFTDMPSVFAVVITLYGCVRALESISSSAIIRWLVFATVANLFLGTVRQIAWMGALALVPATGFYLRGYRGVLRATTMLWAASCLAVAGATYWLAHQPYAPTEALLLHWNRGTLSALPALPACLLMDSVPLLLAFSSRGILRRWKRVAVVSGAAATVLCVLVFLTHAAFLPAMFLSLLGAALPASSPLSYLMLWLGVACFAIAVGVAVSRYSAPVAGPVSFAVLLQVTALYCVVCLLLIVSREGAWSRYILTLSPVLVLLASRLYAEATGGARFPLVVPAVVVVYAMGAVVVAHDNFAWLAPWQRLEQWYVAQGLPRNQLNAGWTQDGTYEFSIGHTMNEPRILYPKDAYTPRPLPPEVLVCVHRLLDRTLDIHPAYVFASQPSPNCTVGPAIHEETGHMWSGRSSTISLYRLRKEVSGW